jgi:predicted nucleotidyltransferase
MSRTFSTLTQAELDAYRKALRSRTAVRREASERLLKQARTVASRAALLLKDEFGVKKVVVLGSLLQPHLFHSRSDVDLAVWGLTGRNYYRAVGLLQSLDPEIQVDLIAFEQASISMQETILREGQEL